MQDPVLFVEQVFGVEPDEWQKEALMALTKHDRISIRSGHGIGKSAYLSWALIWWVTMHPECKVPCTAPTGHQLNDVLWGEVAKWVQNAHPAIKQLIRVTSDRIERTDNPRAAFAVARTARKEQPEALQGFHSDNLLFLIDEASGVDDVIFEVGEGALSTKGAKVIMTGNPTRTSGYFYDSHHRTRESWYTMRVSSADAKMVDEKFIRNMELRYGRDSNIFRVRVLGEFPAAEDNVVIPLSLVEDAVMRDSVSPMSGKVVWGLDVSRFGDDRTALAKRQRNKLLEPIKHWHGKDLMQTVGLVVHEYDSTKEHLRPDMILVDSIGIGAGVVDRLREQGYPVRGINVSESPSVSDKFVRQRDELWWKGREWFESREVSIPDQDELIGELTALTYDFTSSGKIKVESKADAKKRGIRSPDIADAFLLTFAVGDQKFTGRIQYPDLGLA
jgi:hypothetical protein